MRRLQGGEDEQRAVTGVVSRRGQGLGRTAWGVSVGPALHPATEQWLRVPRRLFLSVWGLALARAARGMSQWHRGLQPPGRQGV